jgi:hypothetical protein
MLWCDSEDRILLNGTDTLAPYIIYRDQTKGAGTFKDRIYGFKAAHSDYIIPTTDTRELYKVLKVGLPDDLWVVSAPLSPFENANPEGIVYTKNGYVYKPPPKDSFDPQTHYGQTSEGREPGSKYIPYYAGGTGSGAASTIVNFNLNVAYDTRTGKEYGYGWIPQFYIAAGTVSDKLRDAAHWGVYGDSVSRGSTGLKAAPVGMWFYAVTVPYVKMSTAASSSYSLWFGTMQISARPVIFSDDAASHMLFRNAHGEANVIARLDDELEAFRPILWARTGSVAVYDGYEMQPLGEEEAKKPGTTTGVFKSPFDFDNFSFASFLRALDDGITVSVIFILNLLPRFFMFLFIILMALACIARAPFWRKFCANVFDPYKVITAGRQTCETIELVPLFICSLIALALFGIFQNGLILDVIGWIVRAVTGILSR